MIRAHRAFVDPIVRVLMACAALVVAACGSSKAPAPVPATGSAVSGRTPDGAITLTVGGEKIEKVAPAGESAAWLWPPIVDSHVHLTYWDVAEHLPSTGIAAVVDLAAPERALGVPPPGGLTVLAAGPMLTHD